jgi:hypothetical protein
MTKKQLLDQLSDPNIPDDAVICIAPQGMLYEVGTIEYHEEIQYFDLQDEKQFGNVVEL